MKILESYKDMMMEFVNEVDDDKIIKYKTKDGEQGEMEAGSAKSMPKDHPAKIAWDKMQDDGDGEEKPKGQAAMGGGDFDRDSNRAGDDDADDMDRDARFAADAEDDNAESDDVEISDSNSGPIDLDDISDMLKKDPEVMEKLGMASSRSPFEMYWDGTDLVSDKFDDRTVASIPDDANMTLGDLKKQIMDFEPEDEDEEETDESITINGKKYKPIKESKQRILKENYDRFFGEK